MPTDLREHACQPRRAPRCSWTCPCSSTTRGIRTAAAATSWQVVALGFCGLDVHDGRCVLAPHLPSQWRQVSFRTVHRGVPAQVEVTPSGIVVGVDEDADGPFALRVGGADHDVAPGDVLRIDRSA